MYCHPTMFDGVADRLYRNNGDGTFTDISKQAGIANPAGKGLGVAFCDYDRDGQTDIYVANDTVRNFLYRNTGKGPSSTRRIAPASGSTPTASRRRAWAPTARTSTADGAAGHLRHQLLGGAEHALPEQGRRHLRRRDGRRRPGVRFSAAGIRDRRCSMPTTTATWIST